MGNWFSRQASLTSCSLYQLLYEPEPILLKFIRKKLDHIVDLDGPNIWAEFLQERAQFFQSAMPMAMKNLSIAQHCDTLHYARIHSGVYRPQFRRFQQGDYVYLQCEAPTTLGVRAGCTIFRMKEVLLSGLLLLEDRNGRECHEHFQNYVPYHLPIEDTVHHELVVVPKGLPCFVCRKNKWAATMLSCD